jgi:phage baseplate assembly protein W
MNPDFKDFYIKGTDSVKYVVNKMVENDVINVIVQKLEMLLFTRTGEVYGQPDFGADLEFYLWQTSVSVKDLRTLIVNQITTYIPELDTMGYTLTINVYEGSVQDILVLEFVIKGYNVEFIVS